MTATGDLIETEQEKEPMLLLDITGSMNYSASANDPTPRKDVIREAIGMIVERLGAADRQKMRQKVVDCAPSPSLMGRRTTLAT